MAKKSRAKTSGGITKDLSLKIAAVAAAALVWLAVTLLGARTVTVSDVPVSVVNVPSDLGLASELPTVSVRLRVPRTRPSGENLQQLVRAIVDLEGSGIGERSVPVTAIPIDSGVSVVSVTPSSLRVALDPLAERDLPVRISTDGEPAEGYRVGDTTVSSEEVRVQGALGMLQKISGVDAHVSVEGADSDIETEVQLSVPDTLRITPDTVTVRIVIEQADTAKTVGIEVRTTGNPASGYFVSSVAANPQVAHIQGPRELLDNLGSVKTEAINIDGVSQTVEDTVKLDLPEGVSRSNGDETVRVKVEIAPLEGTKEVQASVSVTNAGDGLRVASVSPASLRVTLRGSSDALDRIRDGDVIVAISVSGKSDGEVRIRPTEDAVRVPSEVRAVGVEDREVTVVLEAT